MRKIYYFQRYSQKENWITNNTLLLLSRINQYRGDLFNKILNAILEESKITVNIGPSFFQQEKTTKSVTDGVIEQSSFKIVIETKLTNNFTLDQLTRHLSGFKNEYSKQILLALSSQQVSDRLRAEVNKYVKENHSDQKTKFASISFEDLIKIIDENISEYELEIKTILNEFRIFCEENKLINEKEFTLTAFSAGKSINENIQYNIYYDPAERSHIKAFNYIGLYSKQNIEYIGEVDKVVYCDYDKGKLIINNENKITLEEEEEKRIIDIIEQTDYYDLWKGVKFFLVKKFIKTNFKKTSGGPLRGKRYFNLKDFIDFDNTMSVEEICNSLKGKTWE